MDAILGKFAATGNYSKMWDLLERMFKDEAPIAERPPERVAQLHEALTSFYAEHDPEKVQNVDAILEKLGNQPERLCQIIKDKYGVSLELPQQQQVARRRRHSQRR